MSDLRSRFLAAAVQPLHDNAEQKLAATQLLDSLCPPADAAAERAIRRWEEIDVRPRKAWPRIALFAVLGVVSAVLVFLCVREARDLRRTVEQFRAGTRFPWSADPADWIGGRLTAQQKRLMLSDSSLGPMLQRSKALWDSEPENAAYFGEYANLHLDELGELPADFLATARQLDPNNSWFTYLAAATLSRRICEQMGPAWYISDQEKLAAAMALFHEASHQPRFDSYQPALLRQRIGILPQTDQAARLRSVLAINSLATPPILAWTLMIYPISARAWQLGEADDIAGYRELSADADLLISRMLNPEAPTLLEAVVARNSTGILMKNLGETSKKLGLAEESARRLKVAAGIDRLKEEVRTQSTTAAPEKTPPPHGNADWEILERPPFRHPSAANHRGGRPARAPGGA